MNLCEAFRALNALNEDTFSVDADGINKLSEFEQSDDLTDEISIIDPEAETEEELSDSYVGKVILDCCVCHSKLYKSKEEVTLDDEGLLANVGEECPYCYTPDGFKVIGEVAPFDNANADSDGDGSEEEPIEELFDANVNLDARGFGGKDNQVSVLGGKMPMGESLEDDYSEEELEEGIFGIKTKREKDLERRRAETNARIDKEFEEKRRKERARMEQEDREKDARSKATQRRLDAYDAAKRNSSSGRTSTSNTGYAGINYSGGDYYSEGLNEYDDFESHVNTAKERSKQDTLNRPRKSAPITDREMMKSTTVRPSANFDWDISLNEDSAVATRPSIASVLSKNMDSLYSYDNPSELRNAIMDVVSNSDVDPKEVNKLQRALFSKKSVSALLSTIGTYMTGERVVDTTGRNAENNKAVNESKPIGGDTEVLTVGKLTRLVKKITGLDTYKTHSTSIRGYRSPGEGSFQVTKEGLNSFRIIFYRNKEMQQKVKDELISQGYKVCDMANDIVVNASKCVSESKSINESVNNITIETDDDTVDVALDGNGGVNVTAEPNASATPAGVGETIVPVSDETMNELEGNGEAVEEPTEGEEMDVDIDEFDEESFDELGESYFKRIYENVDGYKTTAIKELNNQLVVEGTLKFNSGNQKKTSFVFEALDIDKNGRARFVGDNKQLTEGRKAFTLTGRVSGNKFITESMNYNYRDKGTDGKTTRVYGNVRVNKRG